METTKVSLSKALKLKNRLSSRLVQCQARIHRYNSTTEGSCKVDVDEMDKLQMQLIDAIISLRTAIYKANIGVYKDIEGIKQKKLLLQFLQSLNTRDGTEPNMYGGDTVITYVATIKQDEVDRRVNDLEREIDAIQDRIDAYNAVPERVEIDSNVLAMTS